MPMKKLPLPALYAALAAVWGVFAHWAVPPVIDAAYHGRGPGPLHRFFRGRQPHPVEHYFQLWNDFAAAVLIAGALHLALVLLVRRLGVSRRLVGFAAVFLGVTLLSGPRHDYVADLDIWGAILRGGDPWFLLPGKGVPLHAYGPLFNALAIPASFNPMLPKLLFAFAYLAAVAWLIQVGGRGLPRAAVFAWLANPFAWVEVAYFGHWDVLVAVACVAAVHERRRGRDVASGAWLAAGILLKYLPVVILPFLAVEGRRVRWRLLVSALLLTAAGLALSGLIWGPSTFRPLAFGASRPSTLLSVFRFLRGTYSPLRLVTATPDADALATPCLALAGLGVFAWCLARRIGPAAGSTLAVLATILFFRVGFPQYQLILGLLASYWIVAERPPGRDRPLVIASWLYFGWLAAFDVFYALVGGVLHPGDRFAWTEEVVGLPTFLLGAALLVAIVRDQAPPSNPSP